MHKRRNNVRENIERDISSNETYTKSFEDEAQLLNELPNATAVATDAASIVSPDAALIEKIAPTKLSVDQLYLQPTDSDKSKLPNAMSLFVAKPHESVFANNATPEPTVAGIYTIEPVACQRNGTQRYYQRPRLKPWTRDAVLVIIKLILLLPLVAGYLPLAPCGAMDRNSKNTLN